MADIDKTARVGQVTPVLPGRPPEARKGRSVKRPGEREPQAERPRRPATDGRHEVDDYA